MEAIVVGIRKMDFTASDGRVKRTVYYVNHPGRDVEGFETGHVSWDEIRNGPPPLHAIGEVIEVEHGKRSLQFPLPKLTDAYKISVETMDKSKEEKPSAAKAAG